MYAYTDEQIMTLKCIMFDCMALCSSLNYHVKTTCDFVRSEVFTAVTMKNCVFWDVSPCGSCKNRHFGGTQRILHQGDKKR
jgi:hypothetical protein